MQRRFAQWVAFQPPSDMSPGAGGAGGAKKLWVGLGVGCAVVVLVIALAFGAGAFKAVSCCNQVQDVAVRSMGAQKFASEFADDIHADRLDAAYGKTSEGFRAGMTQENFKGAVAAHRARIASSPPRMFNMNVENAGNSTELGSLNTWRMSYQFADTKDDTMLIMDFTVESVGSGESAAFVVSDVKFDERARDLSREPPARAVLEAHRQLQGGAPQLAYMQMSPEFRKDTDLDTFNAFLADTGDVLTNSTLEIREVAYDATGARATVMAHAKAHSGKSAIVQFELVSPSPEFPGVGWQVAAIAPLIASDQQAPDVQDAGAEAPDAAMAVVVVFVDKKGDAAVQGDAPKGTLEEQLAALRKTNPDAAVVIKSDPEAKHGTIVSTMDAIKAAGFERVSISVE